MYTDRRVYIIIIVERVPYHYLWINEPAARPRIV